MTNEKKKVLLIVLILVSIFSVVAVGTYLILHDDNKLDVKEKEWIADNTNNVQNVYVVNDIDILAKNGSGVIFDFLDMLKKEYSLDINPITYNSGEQVGDRAFKLTTEVAKNQTEIYKEHYVLISKSLNSIESLKQLNNINVGVVINDEKSVNNYLNGANIVIKSYETPTKLFEALELSQDITYAIVPLEENLSSILTSNYYIDYHISDLNKYLVYEQKEGDLFSSIVSKYFAKFKDDELLNSYNKNELDAFLSALSVSDKDLKKIQGKTYQYGFLNNSPYEILTSGTYGGIVSEYLSRFGAFSGTEFNFTRYKNFNKFTEAVANNKIDLYYNYYNITTEYNRVDSLDYISFVVVAPEEDSLVINSVGVLGNTPIYVLKDSILEKYLDEFGGLKVKVYENTRDLRKIANKGYVIAIDKLSFEYYNKDFLSRYNIRYENVLNDTYNFFVKKDNEIFELLYAKYINLLDPKEIRVKGLYNHSLTVKSGTIIGQIARYALIIIFAIVVFLLILYKSTKKVKIAKKIKKEDKLKYIDQLTSLKNRNYLNDSLPGWNKNSIYPQATVVIDLNKIQDINDTDGYDSGDKQIKAAANVLVRTQLDNSDIIRTDGNEFLLYLVGYSEKQVVSYIRKLNKEFKKLPYEYGAAIGYSMVLNEAKTLEDAINESVDDMKNKKNEQVFAGEKVDEKES